jgi:hypothetical protein
MMERTIPADLLGLLEVLRPILILLGQERSTGRLVSSVGEEQEEDHGGRQSKRHGRIEVHTHTIEIPACFELLAVVLEAWNPELLGRTVVPEAGAIDQASLTE